jgi:DNA-binding transcriptional ArsR family regulator
VNGGSDAERAAGVVFAALADPTRRAVLREVAEQGPVTATELAARVPVTRQAIAKHLGVLAEAGLVTPTRAGRENRFTAAPAPLADAERWLRDAGSAWDDRLARLQDRVRDRTATSRHQEPPRGG